MRYDLATSCTHTIVKMMICFDGIIIKIVDGEDLCKGDGKSESATSDERYMWFVRLNNERW